MIINKLYFIKIDPIKDIVLSKLDFKIELKMLQEGKTSYINSWLESIKSTKKLNMQKFLNKGNWLILVQTQKNFQQMTLI